jgi:hypothetical protein
MIAVAVAQSHTTAAEWLFVVGAFAVLGLGTLAVVAAGTTPVSLTPRGLLVRAGDGLRRTTGLPPYAAATLLIATWALAVAFLGFVWDVSWHIDLGRDSQLFTPAHTLILVGLGGMFASGVAGIVYAALDGVETAWQAGRLRIPPAAGALVALGAGGMVGFPLDDLWHSAYGVDVTMWGPTHLLMIGSASLAPIALWLMWAESTRPGAGRPAQWMRAHVGAGLPASVLVGLSTFQLEFDDGVPQWQALFQPVLIALAAGVALTAARVVLGRGGALRAVLGFLVLRSVMALVVGAGLGLTTPRFPLYLGMALCVEAAAELTRSARPLVSALVTGALLGTVGLATEWGFSHVWGREPWQPGMLPGMWVALLAALGGAVVGRALGDIVVGRRTSLRAPALTLAAATVVVALVVPLPRHGVGATAVVTTTPTAAAQPAVDRYGRASLLQPVQVGLRLTPAEALDHADLLWVIAWQGGGKVTEPLIADGGGVYHTAGSVPTGGAWKTIVLVADRDVLAAVPVSMPADLDYGQGAIPVAPSRSAPLNPASVLLTSESHAGDAWPAVVAYSGLAGITGLWMLCLVAAFLASNRTLSPAQDVRRARGRAPVLAAR